MARQTGFFDKLVSKLERLDPASLQAHFLSLARERGMLDTVFQTIQEGVLVVSGDGLLLYANHASEMLLGLDAERCKGRPVTRFIPDVDWDRLSRHDEDEWEKLFSSEIEVSYPARRILNFYAVPLPEGTDDEAEEGVLVMLRDVTREREQETTMLESERLQAVRALASGVAHEIGNPLNALGIHLQLFDREIRTLPEDKRESLHELVQVARDEVARLNLILTQFLGALRPAAPDFEKGNLADVFEETLRVMRTEIENKRIDVSITRPEKLPDVFIDGNQMKQVFFNIVKNALQAMPDGGTLSVGFEADDGNLSVSVRDNGTGIPPEDFRRMFEPYHTTKAKGNGIGLMIVQRVIQDHGGRMEVASKPGEGTVFRIVLPLASKRIRLLSGKKNTPPAGGVENSMEGSGNV